MKHIHYFKVMSNISAKGNMEVLLAEYHLRRMEWGMALQELQKGFAKGGIHNENKARRLLANVYKKLHT